MRRLPTESRLRSGSWTPRGPADAARDRQPHLIVAEVEPMDVDGVRTVEVGTVAVAARRSSRSCRSSARSTTTDAPGGCGPPGRVRPRADRHRVLPPPAQGARAMRSPRRLAEARAGSEAVDLVDGRGCRRRAAAAAAAVLLGQPDLGVGAAAVVEGDHPAVVVGVAVGADAERSRRAGRRSGPGSRRSAAVRARTGRAGRRGRRRRRTSAGRRGRGPRATACAPGRGRGPWRPGAPAPCRRCRAGRRRRSTSARGAGRRRRPAAGRRATGRRAGCRSR